LLSTPDLNHDFHESLLHDENTSRLLRVFIGLILGGSVAYLAALPFSVADAALRGPGIVGGALCALASLVLLRRNRVGAAAGLLIWGLWGALFLQLCISNGLMSRTTMLLPLLIVLAGWLLPARGAIALCLASVLAGLALALAERAGVLPLLRSPTPPLLAGLALAIYVALAAAVAYHVFRGFRLRYEALRRLGIDLSARVETLAAREAELRLLMESVPVMIFHGDRNKRCLYANRSYAGFYAAEGNSLVGLSVREIVGEAAYEGVDARIDRALAGERLAYRGARRSPRGEDAVLDIELLPEPDGSGGTRGFFAVINDVTAQVQAGAELRRSEEKFSSVFRFSPLAVAITRLEDGRYLDVNDSWTCLFGWPREEVIGRTSLEMGKWLDAAERAAWAAALRHDGHVANREVRFRTKAGSVRDVLLSAASIDLGGETCALVMVADISDRKAAEQALRDSEERLRLAASGGGIGIWEWNTSTNGLLWNPQLRGIFGLPADAAELTLDQFVAAIHPDDLARTQEAYLAALNGHHDFDCEYRIVRPDGDTRWIVARGHGHYDAAGQPQRMLGMAIDITERRRAEEKFAKVFQASPVAISISRIRDGHYIDVNDAFIEQFGWSRDEFIGHTALEIGIWTSQAEREKWVAELQKAGRVKNWETALNSKSGDRHSVIVSAERIWLEGEECVIGLVHDITERLRAETALRKSEARLREAQRIGRTGSWDLDIVSRRMTWSDELHRIYEREPGSFACTWESLLSLVHPDDLPLMQNAWRTSPNAEGSRELRHRILTPDGRVKHLHVCFEIVHGSDGTPVRALGTAQDITEQVLAREEIQSLNAGLEQRVQERTAELQAANKELESFAYSISHDLRAPLRGIDGFSHLLSEEYADRLDETGRGYLDRVRRAAQRMGTLIDDILELARVTRLGMRRSSVDLSEIAREILDERMRSAPGSAVQVVLESGCSAHGDPQLLRVLLQNLLENAWKYSGKESAPRIEFGCTVANGERVFHVRDNGVGFDMQYAGRLFAPFQRLHNPEAFEGTGIGLATVARVVTRHGGRVWAESAPGQGATFRFTLGQAHGDDQ